MTTSPTKYRSNKQNNALHLMFENIADELNDSGMYIGQVIRLDARWNKERVKELIWKPTQEVLHKKKSTTQLTTKEIDEVFEVIHQALASKGIQIVFPSIEEL